MSEQKHTPGPLLKQIQDWVNLRRLDGTSSYSGGYNDGMDEVIGLVATYEKANGALIARAPELLQQVNAIGELLAIMHGDGGHHEQKVGTKQAILDAIESLHKKWVTNEHLQDINKLSEQVAELTKENERLKEDKTNLETSVKNLVEMYEEKIEERKELVEALRARYEHLKWLKDVNTTPPSVIDEINFLQSLLSKFEVPNQS